MSLWTLKDKTILVVDDIPEMRSIMRSMLSAYGATDIHQARTGDEAIEHLAARAFDLVMCDYNLGKGRDGQQVLEEARHRRLMPYSTTFVMITAENTSDMVMGVLEHQPDAYLSKPIPRTTLQTRLRKLFEKKARLAPIYSALDAGEHAFALELCDERLAADDRDRYALLELRCDLLERLDRHDEVETLCGSILDERELPWASLALGRAYFNRCQHELAQETFEDLIDYNASFVVAYDWLARTHRALGEDQLAQEILHRAVERSPKSLPRQRALAEVARANRDPVSEERARRAALRVGQGSVTRRASDYTGMAEVLAGNGKGREALSTLDNLRRDYPSDPRALLEAAAAEIAVHRAAGDGACAAQALAAALELLARDPGSVRRQVALALAHACLAFGQGERADELVRDVVRNHHDEPEVLDRVARMYEAAGRAEEGRRLVSITREEAVRINDEGVKLREAGKVEESVELFSRALKGMPRNPMVNLNAAQSLAMAMQGGRVTRRRLGLAMSCLEVAGEANPADARYRQLLSLCNRLAAARAS
jgi:CheY-like chemotaxis protein/Tfp pilus assembly protein PilF